jgi:hypothetical protein
MGAKLPLDRMTISEKRPAGERRWDDLCHNAENVPSPAWREAVLAERERLISQGRMGFTDLDEAKERIRRAAHGTD